MSKRRSTTLLLPLLILCGCAPDTWMGSTAEYALTTIAAALVVAFGLMWHALRGARERVCRDRALRSAEQRFRSAFQASSSPQAILRDAAFVEINDALARLLGREAREMLSLSPWDFMPQKQPNGDYSTTSVLLRTAAAVHGRTQSARFFFTLPDASLVELDMLLQPLEAEGTPLLCTLGEPGRLASRDDEAEDRLAMYRSALSKAPVGILLAQGRKDDWTLELTNDAALRLLGLTEEQTRLLAFRNGEPTAPLPSSFKLLSMQGVAEEDARHPLAQLLERAARMDDTLFLIENDGGRPAAVRADSYPLFDAQGRTRGGMIVLNDLTEQRRAEDSLIRAKDSADRANLTKNEFLANMSHELRTPLNAVLGMLQLLKRSRDEQERAEYVDIALRSGRGLLTILSDILDLTMIETGNFEPRNEGVNVADLVDTVVEAFELQAKDKSVDIEYQQDESVPNWIVCDSGRLRQVLFNIVGNAVKFTDQGTVRVESALLEPRYGYPHPRIYFAVTDTGIGVPDDKLESIFEPFIQADGSMTRMHGGAGLGLSIARRLVRRLGGEIAVESEPGGGTTFHFTMKVQLSTGTKALPRREATSGPLAVDLSSARVLLVEDDRDMQFLGRRFLDQYGVSCELAENGEQAIAMLRTGDYTLVLMDIQMPVMDGLEATRRIRSGSYPDIDPEIPIVAMTAHGMLGDRERFLAAGMTDYISKPVDEVDLADILRRHALPEKNT
jgi:signal transduction histidine kinase/CheY-like chemotaxis protein